MIFSQDGKLMFGQVREDALVDVYLVNTLESVSRIFVIASGGCTALTLLGETAAHIDALDISRSQIALVELKAELLKLSFDDARLACCDDGRQAYIKVRANLSEDTRRILDKQSKHFSHGLNNCGWVDRRMGVVANLFYWFVHSRSTTETLLRLNDPGEQVQYFNNNWRNVQWRLAMKLAFSKFFLYLVHGPAAATLVPDDFSQVMEARLERALTEHGNASNPYLWQAFFGRYSGLEPGYPPYLQKTLGASINAALVAGRRLALHCADTLSWLKEQDSHSFDYIGLSNIIELLPASYAQALEHEVSRCLRPGGLACVRAIFPRRELTFGATQAEAVAAGRLVFDSRLSQEAATMDRSLFCNFYEVYRLS